jgi:hypothetical protein
MRNASESPRRHGGGGGGGGGGGELQHIAIKQSRKSGSSSRHTPARMRRRISCSCCDSATGISLFCSDAVGISLSCFDSATEISLSCSDSATGTSLSCSDSATGTSLSCSDSSPTAGICSESASGGVGVSTVVRFSVTPLARVVALLLLLLLLSITARDSWPYVTLACTQNKYTADIRQHKKRQ